MEDKYKIVEKTFFYVAVENQPPEPRWLKVLRANIGPFFKYGLFVVLALYAYRECGKHIDISAKQPNVVLQQGVTKISE